MHVLVIVLLYTIHIHEHNSRSNPMAFFLYLSKEKKKINLQYVSTETIFKSYAKSFVASQNPENLLSAKITALSYL